LFVLVYNSLLHTFCVSKAQQAPSASFWEIVKVAHKSSIVDSGRILIMKSLFSYL